MRNIFFSVIVLTGITIFTACKSDDDKLLPVLTTTSISDISESSAIVGGNVSNDKGFAVTFRGICWSRHESPTINDSLVVSGSGKGSFFSHLVNLERYTTYFVRAFATSSEGTAYGNQLSFTPGEVSDIDGNVYRFITIGSQVWMTENLRTTRYHNGDSIQMIKGDSAWINSKVGAYCTYNNDNNLSSTYGHLYNWYAVNDSRSLAPIGWHVPSTIEWDDLAYYLGGKLMAGGKLKEAGLSHWNDPNTAATNSNGFTALPGGFRYIDGSFMNLNTFGIWWTTTLRTDIDAFRRDMYYNKSEIYATGSFLYMGFSVRCIKDQ
jgi:uncharacterized protein (TIGR02145 family)